MENSVGGPVDVGHDSRHFDPDRLRSRKADVLLRVHTRQEREQDDRHSLEAGATLPGDRWDRDRHTSTDRVGGEGFQQRKFDGEHLGCAACDGVGRVELQEVRRVDLVADGAEAHWDEFKLGPLDAVLATQKVAEGLAVDDWFGSHGAGFSVDCIVADPEDDRPRRWALQTPERTPSPTGSSPARLGVRLRCSKMTTIEVATTATDDLGEALARLLPQLTTAAPPSLDNLKRLIADAATRLYLARDGDQIVGTLTLSVFATPTEVIGHISDVVVDEEARGLAVGAALIEAAIADARQQGVVQLQLTSAEYRAAAHRLYERLGFVHVRTNRIYRLSLAEPHDSPPNRPSRSDH